MFVCLAEGGNHVNKKSWCAIPLLSQRTPSPVQCCACAIIKVTKLHHKEAHGDAGRPLAMWTFLPRSIWAPDFLCLPNLRFLLPPAAINNTALLRAKDQMSTIWSAFHCYLAERS